MAANRTFDLTEASNLFKIKYGKLSENVYNSANVVLGRIKKSYNFTGKQLLIPVPQSFAGGVGSGSLPTANVASYEDAQITAKKVYAVVEIDRESIKASMSDEGAFVRATKEVVKKGVESWMRNMSRILLNELANGSLGTTTAANATGSAAAPVVIITDATWKEANWEERDLVNFNSDAAVFEVSSVDVDNKTVTLSRISGSLDLTGTGGSDVAYMQNSKDNDPESISGVISATSSTKYAITVARRWKAYQYDASSAALSTDLMNKIMLGVEKQCGKAPNMIVTSYKQYEKLLNILEDQKEYSLSPRDNSLKGKISFSGVQFMSAKGPIGVFAERFVNDAHMYFLNDNHIEIYHRPDFGWFDDDGTVFLRKASSDAYEARYGGYLQVYVNPCFHGYLYGLA